MESEPLSLIGGERDVADLPQFLRDANFNIRPPDAIRNGDYVAFCIACTDGPTEGTRQSILGCAGLTIRPVGIILTRAELVDDDSLRSLVTCEEMELLSLILPCSEADSLLVLYDFDPNLISKISSRLRESTGAITCKDLG